MLPKWALLPTAWKIFLASFRHPKRDLVIVLDEANRRVRLVPQEDVESRLDETANA